MRCPGVEVITEHRIASIGIGAEKIVEAYVVLSDAVEMRSLIDNRAVAAHGVDCVIVGHNEEGVGSGHGRVSMNFYMRYIWWW